MPSTDTAEPLDVTHPCWTGIEDDHDHDWEYKTDSAGDPGVVNGTYSLGWWECACCGETKEGEPPSYDDDY